VQFRQQALSKQQSPEELDLPVRFARPQGLLVLIVVLIAFAAAGIWSVTGSVSSRLDAPGILTYAHGSYVVQSPVSGQITGVYAKEGQFVDRGERLLRVRTQRGELNVRALARGRVTALKGGLGAIVSTGTGVATVERTGKRGSRLRAMVYVPAGSAASVDKGAAVDLTVQSAPSQRYGVLRGTVQKVGGTAQSRQQIAAFLGDSQLGEEFTESGRPVPVLVRLRRSAETPTGYRWSTSRGPAHRLGSMTLAGGSVHLADQRPIDWLAP